MRLEDLVTQAAGERDLIAVRVEVGFDRTEVLNRADARVADAKLRLVKARFASPVVARPSRT